MATSTTAAPSIDDPNLQSAYTHFQEAMCGAYGMAGAGSLRRHFKQNASLADGAETIVVAGTNSREEVVGYYASKVADIKKELPTLAKVLVSTTEYKAVISADGGQALVTGAHVVHFKSSGFARATEHLKGTFTQAGHWFGSLFSRSKEEKEVQGEEGTGHDVAEAAAADPSHDLKTETHRFCLRFERGGATDGEWKVVHVHRRCDGGEVCAACKECALG